MAIKGKSKTIKVLSMCIQFIKNDVNLLLG